VFQARPNRFLVQAKLRDGQLVLAHLADPGRLRELLLPGVALRLRPVPPSLTRKTRYTVVLARSPEPPRPWVCLETLHANRLAGELLSAGQVRGIGGGWDLRPEVRRGNSRFDFLLQRQDGDEMLVEVKSVTLVENGVALFPDAPTARGARHVRELEQAVRNGTRAAVLFVVQREDARAVAPHAGIDPEFTLALQSAAASGVLLRAARFRMRVSGQAEWLGSLPVRVRKASVGRGSTTRPGSPPGSVRRSRRDG
jgi:sugar fermentation stimulation protein A